VLQGVFGALLVPGGLAIINTNFPDGQRPRAIGQWSAWSALAAAVGPLLGGVIVDSFSWRWIFFINVPLVVVCAVLALHGVRESHDKEARHLDVQGAVLAVLALGGITYGLIEGPGSHWGLGAVLAIVAGVVSFGLFLLAEWREKDPMVHLSLFASRNFTAANITTFAMYGALSGFFFAFVIYLQTRMGYSTLQAGLGTLPVTIFLLTLSGKIGALSGKIGPRIFMTVGPLLAAGGIASLHGLQPGDSYALHILPGVMLFGLGMSSLVAPLTVTVMSSVSKEHSGIASGINNAVSRVAGLIVIALLGLFGVTHAFSFTVILCAGLAAVAGLASWLLVRNPAKG
jgi:EmrB/QacA subfamily drug resistance transporter